MTTLIVNIPAYNEEETIGDVIREIPRQIPLVDKVLVLVFDDGSSDRTQEVAFKAGADFIYRHHRNRGLAITFRHALDAALDLDADIIVNTDADNHYDQSQIPQLIAPVLLEGADIVVGSRSLGKLAKMPYTRLWGNRAANSLFTFLYRLPPGTDVSSGFRAYSRDAAMRLTVTSKYTYAHETLIVARDHNLTIASKLIPARDVSRPSRLMPSLKAHIFRAGSVALLSFAVHRLFHIALASSIGFWLAGTIMIIRFLYLFAESGGATGHVQSLVIGSLLILIGLQLMLASFFGLSLSKNRQLVEEVIYQQRKSQYKLNPYQPVQRADFTEDKDNDSGPE